MRWWGDRHSQVPGSGCRICQVAVGFQPVVVPTADTLPSFRHATTNRQHPTNPDNMRSAQDQWQLRKPTSPAKLIAH